MKSIKGKNVLALRISVISLIVVAIIALVCSICAFQGVIKGINAFMILFIILTLGVGLVGIVYGIIANGGGEFGIGAISLAVGVMLILIQCKVHIVIIILSILAVILIAFLGLILMKSKHLVIEKSDEKPDYVPYTEQLAAKKAAEKQKEEEEGMPTIKSFAPEKKQNDNDNK